MKNKIMRLVVIAVILVLSLCVAGITAYLADSDLSVNEMTIGGSNIQLIEEFVPPAELLPGVSFTKNVQVKNKGPNDCYVRVYAAFSNGDMEKYCTVDWNTDDWAKDAENGYWYYTNALAVNEMTPSLFTTVTLKEDAPEAAIRDFDIIVYAESYQAEGFSSYTAAWNNYKRNKPTITLPSEVGQPEGDTYEVLITTTEGVNLSVDRNPAQEGETVCVTVDTGGKFTVDVSVLDAKGNALVVTKVSDTQYTFTMPAMFVTVSCAPPQTTETGTGTTGQPGTETPEQTEIGTGGETVIPTPTPDTSSVVGDDTAGAGAGANEEK